MKQIFNENEVTTALTILVDNLIEFTFQKDIDKLMSLYIDSKNFQIIDNEGLPKNIEELKEMYSGLFANLDYVRVLESQVKVTPLNNDCAYCVWQGKEEIKMIESEEIQSAWTATIIATKLNDVWKIIHFHATHY